MPSFEADVVLRPLISGKVCATVGPSYLGPDACADLASKLKVDKYQLWGAICNLRMAGRVEDIRVPDDPSRTMLFPTQEGERYFQKSSRKQPYIRTGRYFGAASAPA